MNFLVRYKALWLLLTYLISLPLQSTQQSLFTTPTVSPHVTIREDATIGAVVTNVIDGNAGGPANITGIEYKGSDKGFYARQKTSDHSKWEIILNRTLDYETTTSLVPAFEAKNHKSDVLSTEFRFKLHLQDVNDNAPAFINLPYNAAVNESAHTGLVVYTSVMANDVDTGPGGAVIYQLVPIVQGGNSADVSKFTMDSNTGNVTLNGSLDYETKTFYHYNVIAKDRGTPSLSSTTDLFITVKDVQDTPPVFTNLPYVASVTENSGQGTSILKLTAVDQDRAIPNHVDFNITDSTCPALFQVDTNSGVISVAGGTLDRDAPPLSDQNGLCILHVQATEEMGAYPQHGPFTATATVTVTVDDANDNAPQFVSGTPFTANITENSPPSTPLRFDPGKQIIVRDIDQGQNSAFNLTLSDYTHCLEVTPARARSEATVVIKVTNGSCFDFETTPTIDFKVTAKGEGDASFVGHASVHLDVINVNDFAPVFTKPSYARTVDEGLQVSSSVITVHANDLDSPPFNELTYSIHGGDDIFTINSTSGVVTVAKTDLDYETRREYQLTVEATDTGDLRGSATLNITLQDVNDNAPQFLRPEYQAFVVENEDNFSRGVTVQADDRDGTPPNNEVLYNLSGSSAWSANFSVNPTTGELLLTSPLDYEQLDSRSDGVIHLIVLATDRGSPPKTGSVNVTVTVQDANDCTPKFASSSHSGRVAENKPAGAYVTTLHANDSDGSSPNKDVFYMINSGGGDQFRINSTSGKIYTTGPLNREQTASYSLVVFAVDRGSPSRSASAIVSVDVTNINDDMPKFQSRVVTVTPVEEQSPGSVVYSFNATDKDDGALLKYSVLWNQSVGFSDSQTNLNTSVLQDALKIDNSTGTISVNRRLDREIVDSATLIVVVQDLYAAPNTNQTATGMLSVQVQDIDDNPPEFSHSNFNASIDENSPDGTPLRFDQQMSLNDPDKDANSRFSLSLSNHSDCLKIVPSAARSQATVIIQVKNSTCFDYETSKSMDLEVIALPDVNKSNVQRASVHLSVINKNDEEPTFSNAPYTADVFENAAIGTPVTKIQASDKDCGLFGTIHYKLEGDASSFTINSTTGDISTSDNTLDREVKDTYLMTVVATDGGGRRSGASLTITVTDVNDKTPRFRSNYSTTVKENSAYLTPPVFLKAEDDDQSGTLNSHVTYQMHNCHPVPCYNFSLDANSGHLTINSELDYEKIQRTELIVWAVDGGSPSLTGTATVHVEVEDLNDFAPKFVPKVYNASITEHAAQGTSVARVSASDGDGSAPNNVTFYVLDSGRGSDNFRVNSTSGEVTVGQGAVLDRETDTGGFSLTLLAIDRGDPPRSSTATLSVTLLDVNDEVPSFGEDVRKEASIYENAGPGDVVALMNASDPDRNSNLDYTWVIKQSQASTDRDQPVNVTEVSDWFAVDPRSGQVTVKSNLDRELAEVVVLKIRVNDTNGDTNFLPQTALATLTVKLQDVNDNPPEIRGSNSLTVSEALVAGTGVASLTAHDADRDETVRFSALSGTGGYFNITPVGKIFLQKRIDRETTPTVNFTVIATDDGSPPLSSNATIIVTVLDANDNDPTFQNTSHIFSVSEDAVIGTLVAIVNATDDDEGSNANVTFSFDDYVHDFTINKTTGAIFVSRKLDREARRSYTLGVVAMDNPTIDIRRRVVQQITININDVNDNPPFFANLNSKEPSYHAQIVETTNKTTVGVLPGPVLASDKDEGENAKVSYHLTSLDDVPFFTINQLTGMVLVNSSIRGNSGVYSYIVTVVDHGQPPLNASANLTIEVKDENLNAPKFIGNYSGIGITECFPKGDSIKTFVAHDADRDKDTNGYVQYFLDNAINAADTSYFQLDPDTGVLSSTQEFDREVQSRFQISVIARDKGLPAPRATTMRDVIITIYDGNDEPPKFNVTTYSFNVTETQDDLLVGRVYAEDPDDIKSTCYSLGGKLSDHFNVTTPTDKPAELRLIKALDRENEDQASFDLNVWAHDCTEVRGSCDKQNFDTAEATVHMTVSDINDNPPNFTSPQLTFGVASTADTGHVIVDLRDYVRDPDIGVNRLHTFHPVDDYKMDPELKPSFGPSDKPLAMSSNGTVTTHAALPGDAEGFFIWQIMANDTAGNDTVSLKIYVVGKDKLMKMIFFISVEELRQDQDDILRDLQDQTGLLFVADDRVQFEDENGVVDPSKSILIVHAVRGQGLVMTANDLVNSFDLQYDVSGLRDQYKLVEVETLLAAEKKASNKTKTEYILAAMICVLVIAFAITLYIMLNNIRRFKRKLKAATTETYAMSGQQESTFPGLKTPQSNPIFGKDEMLKEGYRHDDSMSNQSDDSLNVNLEDKDDEQEMVMDVYGEDAGDVPSFPRDRYLQEALAEHDNSKLDGSRLAPPDFRNSRMPKVVSNGVDRSHNASPRSLVLEGDIDLQGLQSTNI